jgi:NAD(P)-dependent dehydrogenase (short-subunit alcohol dehydrogenase family)
MKSLKDKVVVVTGAGSGIGNALVVELAKQGANLAICDVKSLDKTLNDIKQYKRNTYYELFDITNTKDLKKFTENVIKHFGYIDVLINNAGIALGDVSFENVTEKDFEKITEINYYGVIKTTQYFYKTLLSRPEAALVNLSSSQGILALPYLVPYCTTKFAVRGFTDALRVEHQIRKINHFTVHTVHPGRVATDITLSADYQGPRSKQFDTDLKNGVSASSAAKTIIDGIKNNTSRIFISDGILHETLARLLPSSYHNVISFYMKMKKLNTE